MLNFRAFVGVVIILLGLSRAEYDNKNCIVDKNLAPSEPDNYMDCNSDVMVEMGKTECCQIDAEVGCCEPGGNWKQFRLIGICLGVVTAALAGLCIYCFWCRKNKKVAKAGKFFVKKYHVAQETFCSKIRCCRKQIEERKQREKMKQAAKTVPAFDLPAEASSSEDPTFDNFWRGPMIKN